MRQIPDSTEYREVADDLLQDIVPDEIRSWKSHPCTLALLAGLEGDRLQIVEEWEAGSYTGENADATAQLNARQLGTLQAIYLIKGWIETIGLET